MSSGFISEAEIEKRRILRQEEWEKVRKPDEPVEAPEEPVDTRSLYEQLKAQKDKKQEEYEEAHKLKNLVKVLDDDEVDFLDFVDRAKAEEEKKKRIEELIEINAFRSEVSKLREEELEKHIRQEIGLVGPAKTKSIPKEEVSIGTAKSSQTKLLAAVVKRKAPTANGTSETTSEVPVKVSKQDNDTPVQNQAVVPSKGTSPSSNGFDAKPATASSTETVQKIDSVPYKGNLVCIGVLPGLAPYNNSSDSDDDILGDIDKDSSDSDEEPSPTRDLCGRRIVEGDKQDHQ